VGVTVAVAVAVAVGVRVAVAVGVTVAVAVCVTVAVGVLVLGGMAAPCPAWATSSARTNRSRMIVVSFLIGFSVIV
jgi:hypothetical protein